MSERDELAEVIKPAASYDYWPQRAAELVLAAGYRKPRTITGAEELDALPAGAIVIDQTGDVLKRSTRTVWLSTDEDGPTYVVLPATVLWEPQP